MIKSKEKYNYYKSQLKRVKFKNWNETQSMKIIDYEGNETNWFHINKESIPILIEYLRKQLEATK